MPPAATAVAFSFFFKVSDPLCSNGHGIGGGIVTSHDVLKREYELAIHYPVGAVFADQDRDVVFIGAIKVARADSIREVRAVMSACRLSMISRTSADGISFPAFQRGGGGRGVFFHNCRVRFSGTAA
jgi:hypothetical protein